MKLLAAGLYGLMTLPGEDNASEGGTFHGKATDAPLVSRVCTERRHEVRQVQLHRVALLPLPLSLPLLLAHRGLLLCWELLDVTLPRLHRSYSYVD